MLFRSTIYGLATAELIKINGQIEPDFAAPLFGQMIISWFHEIPEGFALRENAVFMAGWVGMLVTGLNMVPVSQLDGGHVSHAIFVRYSPVVARGFLMFAIAFIVSYEAYREWCLMLF